MSAEPRRATKFLLSALGWSLGMFVLLRIPWVDEQLVLPVTQLQKEAADYYAGSPAAPIVVTQECSGADVLALCLAAILAGPVSWRARLAGAAGAVAFVLGLNTVRIATLGLAAASPALFQALHLQVWPAILVLAAAGYVFAWMRMAVGTRERNGRVAVGTRERNGRVAMGTRERNGRMATGTMERNGEDEAAAGGALSPLVRRFAPRAAILLVAFALCGPWIAGSQALIEAGAWTAGAAALLVTAAGLSATATGNVLATSRGAFIVTPECLVTALIPLYVAGLLAVRLTWPWRALAVVAAPPLFAALAVVRLLLLALPPALVDSPLFLVHGFHQLVLGVTGVALLALWREPPGPRRWWRAAARAGAALGVAAILAIVAGSALTSAVRGAARAIASLASHTLMDLAAPGDAQGALALLPVYQAGLLLALGMTAVAGGRRLLAAFGVLLASQVAFLVVLGLAYDAGLVAHALLLRAWAVAVPVVLTLAMLRAGQPAVAPLRPAADGPR